MTSHTYSIPLFACHTTPVLCDRVMKDPTINYNMHNGNRIKVAKGVLIFIFLTLVGLNLKINILLTYF